MIVIVVAACWMFFGAIPAVALDADWFHLVGIGLGIGFALMWLALPTQPRRPRR